MRKKLSAFAALLIALLLSFSFSAVFAAETGIQLFTDSGRTQAAGDTVSIRIGERRTDLYYSVNGQTDTAVQASAEDDSVVQVVVLTGRIGFVATASNRVGTTSVTITAEGCDPLILTVETQYPAPAGVELETDGDKPGAINRVEIGDSMTVEYGIEFPVYATAVDASGNAGTLDPSLEFVWTFDENACGATFTPAEGAAEEADIAGKISVSGTGTAAAEVALYLNGEPMGVAKRFTLNAVYQQMAADVDILANDISITGIRYTVGEEKVSLVYQQDGNNLSQEAALGQVKIDYTVSNKAYLDPADVVWSSTDPNSVRVENGTIVFAEDITGPKQVTITVTNLDKTVMDSFLVVVNRAASSSGGEEKGSGCASSMAAVGSAGIAAAALCTALLLLRRKKQG